MFSFFKAKPPENKYKWAITVDGFGIYRVTSRMSSPVNQKEDMVHRLAFLNKIFTSLESAELAIRQHEDLINKSQQHVVKEF